MQDNEYERSVHFGDNRNKGLIMARLGNGEQEEENERGMMLLKNERRISKADGRLWLMKKRDGKGRSKLRMMK